MVGGNNKKSAKISFLLFFYKLQLLDTHKVVLYPHGMLTNAKYEFKIQSGLFFISYCWQQNHKFLFVSHSRRLTIRESISSLDGCMYLRTHKQSIRHRRFQSDIRSHHIYMVYNNTIIVKELIVSCSSYAISTCLINIYNLSREM